MTSGKIKSDEWYTMQDIIRERMFPTVTSTWGVRNLIALDRRNGNVLKATITGIGRGTKYHFQGKNIIKFLKTLEAGVSL